MVLRATLCSSGRLALRTVRTASRYGVSSPQPYLSFPALQRSKVLAKGVGPFGAAHARGFWWSRTESTPPELVLSPPSDTPAPASDTESHLASFPTDTSQPPIASTPSSPNDEGLWSPDASIHTPTLDISPAATPIPPLQPGDLYDLGLISWWSPAGWVRYSLEVLHTSTGLPWFYVIIIGTIAWRMVALPLGIIAVRNAARLRPFAAQLRALDERTSQLTDQAVRLEVLLEKKRIHERAGVGIGSTLGAPVAQLVLQLGLFLGIKGMVTLPLPQLRESGVSFLPDLTAPGEHYTMPLVIAALASLQLTFQKRELDVLRRDTAHVFNVLRLLSFGFVPFMSAYPDGLWLTVAVGLVVSLVQTRVLQIPWVRQRLGILPVSDPLPPVSTMDTVRLIADRALGTRRVPLPASVKKVEKSKGGSEKARGRP